MYRLVDYVNSEGEGVSPRSVIEEGGGACSKSGRSADPSSNSPTKDFARSAKVDVE